MRSLNLMEILQRWSVCQLCKQSRVQQHMVCDDCWHSLPWKKEYIQRLDVQCYAACEYAFPIKHVLHQFKEHAQLHYLNLLSGCLHQNMEKPRIQAIVPMPISTEKLIQRGFHPAYLLAKTLSKLWKVPIWQPISRYQGHQQRGLSRAERLGNLSEQFYPNTTLCRYKHVLMLDDVITTGSSLNQLQTQLIQLGCTHIQALCLCDASK